MAKVKVKNARIGTFGGLSPYGNATVLGYALKTNAAGAVINSDSTEALAIGDVVDLGELPEGLRLVDAQLFVSTAMTALVTGKLGFVYSDGTDSTEVPQDDAYFLTAGAVLNAAGRLRANGTKLVTLPKPARLVLTIAGAANAKASDLRVEVIGELKGPR